MEFCEHTATTSSTDGLSHDSDSLPILPFELIREILLRLPVKTLLKIRCVSKSWLSLISSPQFIKAHVEFSTKKQDFPQHKLIFSKSDKNAFYSCSLYAIIYQESPHKPIELEFPWKDPSVDSKVVGSCNGLICISNDFGDLLLWNPSIRKSKKLPLSGRNVDCAQYLAYGFGYYECLDDYKVVEVVGSAHDEYGFQNDVRVYSLRSNSWERIQDYPGVIVCNDPGIFVHGRLHWLATCVDDMNDNWFISSLHLTDATYEDVAMPNLVGDHFELELGTLGGSLCVFCDCSKVRMDVWVMNEYGLVESWTKMVSVPYFTVFEYSVSPLFISQKDEILLQQGSSILLLYNSAHNTLKLPQFLIQYDYGVQFSLYVESLVSPIME